MPEEPEDWRADAGESGSHHDEGGPVKSFLEHLEDLRWVLIKCLVCLGVAFVVCLVGANWVYKVLQHPMEKAKVKYPEKNQVITFLFGTNKLWVFQLPPAEKTNLGLDLGTNRFVTLHIEPVTLGTNMILGVKMDSDSSYAERMSTQIVSTGPASSFMIAVQLALYGGVLLSSPFILYFVASFVFPALKLTERKYVYGGLFYGLGLFLLGVSFCYFVLMPIALSASVRYAEWMGFAVPLWRAEEYTSFVSKFMLGMGLGFEMPVILLVLVKIGVLNYRMLAGARRYVIVINFILGAVLTTPEIITQVLMALPLQVLYELTIWIAWYWERQDKKREVAEGLMNRA